MGNLLTGDTGLDDGPEILTQHGSHGCRVKWFPEKPGRSSPSLTVTVAMPREFSDNGLLPRIAEGAAEPEAALLDFWQNGAAWTYGEVSAFIDGQQKLP